MRTDMRVSEPIKRGQALRQRACGVAARGFAGNSQMRANGRQRSWACDRSLPAARKAPTRVVGRPANPLPPNLRCFLEISRGSE